MRVEDLQILLQELREAVRRANDRKPRLFRFASQVVEVGRDDRGSPTRRMVTLSLMCERLAEIINWRQRFFPKRQDAEAVELPVKPPKDLADHLLANPGAEFPMLRRIAQTPIVDASGRIVSAEGYDRETGAYLSLGELRVPAVSDAPTEDEARNALARILDDMLVDFPFVDAADKANVLGLMLTPLVREIVGNYPTPLHLVVKPAPGTGAGLLVEACVYVVNGAPPGVMSEAGSEEEWRKRITSVLIEGLEIVDFDNVSDLSSPSLAAVLTATMWSDRKLGSNETVRVPVSCTWVGTGNNPKLTAEVARRIVPIRLDARTARPAERPQSGFRHPNLRRWVSEHRGELVWALLTLIRRWVAAGCPRGAVAFGSYEQWAEVIGGILASNGVPGFLGNTRGFIDRADHEGERWQAFVFAWWLEYADRPVGVKDLWTLLDRRDGVPSTVDAPCDLGAGSDRSQRTRLGDAMSKALDRVFDLRPDLVLTVCAAGKRQGAAQYRLVALRAPSPPPAHQVFGEPGEPCEPQTYGEKIENKI